MLTSKKSISAAIQGFRSKVIGRHKPGIWIISMQSLLTAAGFSITIPFLSLYLFQDRGLSMTIVGTIMLIAGLCSAIAHVLGGELSDRIGRRPVIIGALGIRVLMYLFMAMLIETSAAVWAIVVCYFIGQAIGMMERPASSAIVTDLSPKKRLTETYGLLRVGINLGWAAGPAIGGYLATFLPYSWLFGVAALLTALALLFVLFFLKESHTETREKTDIRNLKSIVKDRGFLIFTAIGLLVFMLMGQMMSTLSIFTVAIMGLSTAQYGFLLTTNGLIVVLFQYPVAYKLGNAIKSRVLIIGSLLYTFGYLIFGWAGGFSWAVIAIVVITIGEIIHAPTSLAVVGELAPPRYSGRYMGVFGLTQILGMAIGPLLGGILLDAFPTTSFAIWGIIAFLGVLAASGYYLWGIRHKMK
jgi:MFS family permease